MSLTGRSLLLWYYEVTWLFGRRARLRLDFHRTELELQELLHESQDHSS
jgi:hypothetical protein